MRNWTCRKAGDRLAAFHTRLLPSLHFQALGAQQLRPVDFTIERGQLGNFEATGPIPSNDVKFSTPLRPTGLLSNRVAQLLTGIHKVRLNLTLFDINKELAQEQVPAHALRYSKRAPIGRNWSVLAIKTRRATSATDARLLRCSIGIAAIPASNIAAGPRP